MKGSVMEPRDVQPALVLLRDAIKLLAGVPAACFPDIAGNVKNLQSVADSWEKLLVPGQTTVSEIHERSDDWELAAKFPIGFGKYKGEQLGDMVADTDRLGYLDWLDKLPDLREPMRTALTTFLDDDEIRESVKAAVGVRKGGRS
jgi:hypothetical protein